ncbi:MAG TPA: protein-export chaperone SecB, partial [Oleiagrimonas sp.]|nr:protein-export chaperone SecB [Oleiagrimonas sp.]
MAETTPANGQNDGQNAQPQMMLQKIYVKDSSFEAPNAPQIFQEIGESDQEPQVQLNLSQQANKLADDIHEV